MIFLVYIVYFFVLLWLPIWRIKLYYIDDLYQTLAGIHLTDTAVLGHAVFSA